MRLFKALFYITIILLFVMSATLVIAQSIDDGSGAVTDMVVGHNKMGPYFLTYNNISPEGLIIVVNGRTLSSGTDYNIDLAGGSLSFTNSLENDSIARVTYKLTPGKSKKASGNMTVPLSLDVFNKTNTNLKVVGLFAQDGNAKSDQGKTIVGIQNENKWQNTSLSTQFLISQKVTDSNDKSNASAMDKAYYKLAGGTSMGALKFSGSLINSGSDFQGDKEYGTAKGNRITDLGFAFAPSDKMSANAKMKTTEITSGAAQGSTLQVNEQSLMMAPADTTKISVVHTTNELNTNGKSIDKSTETSLLKVDQTLGTMGKAAASFENSTIVNGNDTDEVATRNMSVSGKSGNLSMNANLTQKDSKNNGEETRQNVNMNVSPLKDVAVIASFSNVDSEKSGLSTDTKVSVQASPTNNMKINGSIAESKQGDLQNYQRNLSMQTTPNGITKITAGFSQKGNADNADTTKEAAFLLSPTSSTSLSAGIKQIASGTTETTIKDYAASAKPTDYLSISGKLIQRDCNLNTVVDTQAVHVGLKPHQAVTIEGNYQYNPVDDKGTVQSLMAKSVGMRMQIGSIGVITDMSQKDEYMLGRLSQESKFGFDFSLFGNDKLTTAVSMSSLDNGTSSSSRSYILGYKRNVGSNFNLSLTGNYTQYFQERMLMPDKDDLKAEAKLSMGF